ncbi:MAG: D-alanyl-D-alanine carboxypeptidase [Magnetococcales bacterium]|nr:D-alanyl-D-alanine carboxypeptidase [Magnetococcales bacterium]
MLPICRRSGALKILLTFLVLAGLLSPFSACANDERQDSSSGHTQKIAAKKSKKSGKKRVHKVRHARHARAAVDATANYADLVMDARTGRILHATSPDELRHPASLTKMMTLYLAFDALKRGQLRLDQSLPISPNAASQEPSKLGLRVGRQIRVEDALLGLVTKSANDATVVMAEAIGNNEDDFVRMMNNKARELGMNHTMFRNASGLPDPRQVTTARDMAILGYALVYHHPQFYPYFSRENFTYAGIRHNNHNHLMSRYQGMDGIKTGYTRASGFNLVASTVRGSTRLIVVVFGGRSAVSRDNRMAALMDQGFAQLQNERSLQRVASARDGSTNGTADYVPVPSRIPTIVPARHAAVGRFGNS